MAGNPCSCHRNQQQELAKTRSIQDGGKVDWKTTLKLILPSFEWKLTPQVEQGGWGGQTPWNSERTYEEQDSLLTRRQRQNLAPQSSGTTHPWKHIKSQELTDCSVQLTHEFANVHSDMYFDFCHSSALWDLQPGEQQAAAAHPLLWKPTPSKEMVVVDLVPYK